MLLYRTRTLPRLREQSGTGGTGAPASDTQEGPTQPRCPCPWGREDAAYGGEPAHHSACPAKFPVKVNPQCYFLVPVNSQPKAFPPGDKQGCRPCEPARGAACAEACPHTASARRPTGSGGSPPGIGEFSSAWWAAEREDERDEGSGFAQRKEWAREKNNRGFPGSSVLKNPSVNAGDAGSIPAAGGATQPVHRNFGASALVQELRLLQPACPPPTAGEATARRPRATAKGRPTPHSSRKAHRATNTQLSRKQLNNKLRKY